MKRQRNRRGFTLAETLAALVVVVLLAMSVQIGTMTALRARTASRFQSESEILAATLNSALGDMLHYATCARYEMVPGGRSISTTRAMASSMGRSWTGADGCMSMLPPIFPPTARMPPC